MFQTVGGSHQAPHQFSLLVQWHVTPRALQQWHKYKRMIAEDAEQPLPPAPLQTPVGPKLDHAEQPPPPPPAPLQTPVGPQLDYAELQHDQKALSQQQQGPDTAASIEHAYPQQYGDQAASSTAAPVSYPSSCQDALTAASPAHALQQSHVLPPSSPRSCRVKRSAAMMDSDEASGMNLHKSKQQKQAASPHAAESTCMSSMPPVQPSSQHGDTSQVQLLNPQQNVDPDDSCLNDTVGAIFVDSSGG